MTGDAETRLYERWVEQFERIENQTYTLFLYREYWQGLAEITQNADLPPSGIFDAFGAWYATTQATSVRRQVDRRRRTVSFWRLLDEMARHPEVMTRERHVQIWTGDRAFLQEAHRNYDRFAGVGSDRISSERTIEDRDRLDSLATPVVDYVNVAIAHTAEVEDKVATFAELNAAIEGIGELLQKYSSLLRAASLPILTPVHQYDWKAPFRVPWIRDDVVEA
jgi:hypothetical protein